MIIFILKLLLAHIIGDFLFQPDQWIENKKINKQKSSYLYFHILIHSFLLTVLLQFNLFYWKGILLIVISHYLIDLIKLLLLEKWNEKLLFTIDQVLHLSIIAIVVYMYHPYSINLFWILKPEILLILVALTTISYVAGIIVRLLMSNWKIEENAANESLKNAGKYIGILERLFVFGFILLNQWQAIGLLITAKSVFRFSDLTKAKDRRLTEYILIGTLLSFGLAICITLIYLHVQMVIVI